MRSLKSAAMRRSTGAQPRSGETATRSLPRSAPASSAGRLSTSREENGSRLSRPAWARSRRCAVGDGAAHGSQHGERTEAHRPVHARHQAGRRSETRHAAERRRRAQAAAVVGAGGERHLPQSQRRGRAAGGAGAGLGRVERVAGRAVHPVDGVGAGAELGRVGLAQDHAARLADAGHHELVLGRHVVLEQERAEGGPEPRRRLQILHADRQPGEQAHLFTAADGLLDLHRTLARSVRIHSHHGVDCAVGRLDAGKAAFQKLHGRQPALADSAARIEGGEIARLGHVGGLSQGACLRDRFQSA